MALLRPVTEPRERVPRLVAGLVLCGLGIAFMVAADLGLAPWSVLDQGISNHTGIPIGTVSILVGALVLAAWIPLRERPGLGTVLNVLLIGTTIDLALLVLDTPASLPARLAYLAFGVFLWGPGVALYLGCGLGPGPRDGIMTAIVARGWSIRRVRTTMELTVLAVGFLTRASMGPAEFVLNMLGEQWRCALVLLVSALLNAALSFTLVPIFGMLGAATATSTALVMAALMNYVVARRRLALEISIWNSSRGR